MKVRKKHGNQLTLIVMVLMGPWLFFASSCGDTSRKQKQEITTEDVKEELDEAADTTAVYLDQERKKILADYKSKIENAQQQIDELRQRLESTSKKISVELEARVDSLQKQQAEALKDLDQLEKSSDEAWEEIREGLDEALDEIETGIKHAKDEFK